MNKSLQQVAEFHSTFEHPIAKGPYSKEDLKIRQLRIKLLFEELAELAEAGDVRGTFYMLCQDFINMPKSVSQPPSDGNNVDKIEELDALCDIQYVLNGKILTSGLHNIFDIAFDTVHHNNMSKAHRDKAHAEETIRVLKSRPQHGPVEYSIIERNGVIILINDHGKVLKPHDHVKVKLDIEELLTFRAIDSDSDTLLDLKAKIYTECKVCKNRRHKYTGEIPEGGWVPPPWKEEEAEELLNKLKKDNPLFELQIEYGKMLMRHIDSFTPEERRRYDELTEILTKSPNQQKDV